MKVFVSVGDAVIVTVIGTILVDVNINVDILVVVDTTREVCVLHTTCFLISVDVLNFVIVLISVMWIGDWRGIPGATVSLTQTLGYKSASKSQLEIYLHIRICHSISIIIMSSFESLTSAYSAENRFSIKQLMILHNVLSTRQNKVEPWLEPSTAKPVEVESLNSSPPAASEICERNSFQS